MGLASAWGMRPFLIALGLSGFLFTFSTVAQGNAAAAKASETSKLDPAMAASKATDAAVDWHDAAAFGLEGREWAKEERARFYDRLPAAAEGKVPGPVWSLSRDSAGMMF